MAGPVAAFPVEIVRWRREERRHRPHTPSGGLVLEIGSGAMPHPKSNVSVDKYVADDFEREQALDLSRPLVVGDGHRLPFADHSFDYVIAVHVLEHATDPEGFAAEMARVAPAGFVQVPSRDAELTFGWSFHPWLIDREGDALVFEPRGDAHASRGYLMHQGWSESAMFRMWFGEYRSRWHHSVEWRGALEVRVEGTSAAEATAEVDLERTLAMLTEAGERGRVRPYDQQTRAALCCPKCHEALALGGDHAACGGCGRVYPVAGGVPVLLEEAAVAVASR